MMKFLQRKVVVVTRKTRLTQLVEKYNTRAQSRFIVESRNGDFYDYEVEHEHYHTAVEHVGKTLSAMVRVQFLDREFLPTYIFGPEDIVFVIGQDGLVANTLKYLHGQPLVAINPDVQRYDGVLLPFVVEDVEKIAKDVLHNRCSSKNITMAEAKVNDGQSLLAVNDFFVGPRLQISARYSLSVNGHSEQQSSSGVLVSTGLGSTGWLKSLLTGARGMTRSRVAKDKSIAWDAKYLSYAVREPFVSQVTSAEHIYGEIKAGKQLTIESQMPSHGVIFSDGMVDDYIEFNSGCSVDISVSSKSGNLIV